jgi:hypothetical protein
MPAGWRGCLCSTPARCRSSIRHPTPSLPATTRSTARRTGRRRCGRTAGGIRRETVEADAYEPAEIDEPTEGGEGDERDEAVERAEVDEPLEPEEAEPLEPERQVTSTNRTRSTKRSSRTRSSEVTEGDEDDEAVEGAEDPSGTGFDRPRRPRSIRSGWNEAEAMSRSPSGDEQGEPDEHPRSSTSCSPACAPRCPNPTTRTPIPISEVARPMVRCRCRRRGRRRADDAGPTTRAPDDPDEVALERATCWSPTRTRPGSHPQAPARRRRERQARPHPAPSGARRPTEVLPTLDEHRTGHGRGGHRHTRPRLRRVVIWRIELVADGEPGAARSISTRGRRPGDRAGRRCCSPSASG